MYIYNGLILIRWRNILQDTYTTTSIQHPAMGSYNGVALFLSVLYLIDMSERSCIYDMCYGNRLCICLRLSIRFWNCSGSVGTVCFIL